MTIFKDQQFSDGEAIMAADLTNISRYLRAQMLGIVGGSAIVHPSVDVGAPSTGVLFAARGNAAAPTFKTGLQIGNEYGVVFQQIGSGFGSDDANFCAYAVDHDELLTTFGAADPTNPRVDLVAVKLDLIDGPSASRNFEDATTRAKSSITVYPSRVVRLTKQVVVGTPGPSPVEPATPAGFVPWASAWIPAAGTSLSTPYLRDWRVPLGVRDIWLYGKDFLYIPTVGGASGWAPAGGGYLQGIQSTYVSPNQPEAIALPKIGDAYASRLLAVGIGGLFQFPSGTTFKLQYFDFKQVGPGGGTDIFDLSADLNQNNVHVGYAESSLLSRPVWLNGIGAGYANLHVPPFTGGPPAGGPAPPYPDRVGLSVKTTHDAEIITVARFIFAGGA